MCVFSNVTSVLASTGRSHYLPHAAGAPPLFSPFDLVSLNMPKLRPSSDSDDDNDKGCGVSSAHSLASNTSRRGRRKPRKGTGTVSPAGSNARAARAAARAKNITSPCDSSSPQDAVPTEVVTRLYKHGKLVYCTCEVKSFKGCL